MEEKGRNSAVQGRKSPKTREPTLKQETLIAEFIACDNKTEAYKRAYNVGNMSAESIRVRAWEAFQSAAVVAGLEKALASRRKRHKVTADEVIGLLWRWANADLGQVMEWGPRGSTPKASKDLHPDVRAMVQSVSSRHKPDGSIDWTITTADRVKAAELLGRHLGLFTHEGDPGLTVNLHLGLPESPYGKNPAPLGTEPAPAVIDVAPSTGEDLATPTPPPIEPVPVQDVRIAPLSLASTGDEQPETAATPEEAGNCTPWPDTSNPPPLDEEL